MNKEQLTIIETTTLATPPSRQRWFVLYILLGAVVLLIGTRGFYLQVITGAQWRTTAEINRISTVSIAAPRGIIYDMYGKQLVENVSSTDLTLDPADAPDQENESYLIETLPPLVPQINPQEIREALVKARSTQRVILLAKALDHDVVLKIEESDLHTQGIHLVSSLVRRYDRSQAMAHVLGYTTADDLGKTGLEKQYQDLLVGKNGLAYTEINSSGRAQKDLGKQDPIPGKDVHLTLDAELQSYISQLFQDQSFSGAVVALDPRDGAVRALVSYPSFDGNYFSQPALTKNSQAFFQDARQPLFNRATAGMYPPGSTIKPMLAAAGLQEGIITSTTTVSSTGGITVGSWFFPDWKTSGHGTTDVQKAIAESVNTFFYLLTGGDQTHQGLGVKVAIDYLRSFTWGKPTGIDLPDEASGFLPSPEWKQATKHEQWYIGDTYHLGIGQGDVLVTPLQVSSAIAAIANGQYVYQPHFNSALPSIRHRIVIDSQHIKTVQAGMRQTITEGSGRSLLDLSIPVAGKTGTAQVGGKDDTHAWFTSFGPYDRPQLVVTVLLEHAGGGDKVAVPMAKNIWQWWIDHRMSK